MAMSYEPIPMKSGVEAKFQEFSGCDAISSVFLNYKIQVPVQAFDQYWWPPIGCLRPS